MPLQGIDTRDMILSTEGQVSTSTASPAPNCRTGFFMMDLLGWEIDMTIGMLGIDKPRIPVNTMASALSNENPGQSSA